MIQPIARVLYYVSEKVLSVAKSRIPFFESTITSLRVKPAERKKLFFALVHSIWNWIKSHFLFLFFEEEDDDNRHELHDEISVFFHTFLSKLNESEDVDEMFNAFMGLSEELQEDVKKEMLAFYHEEFPSQNEEFYREKIQQQLDSPFASTEKDATNPLAHAILEVQSKYSPSADQIRY